MTEMQAPVHVGVRERDHKFLLGGAVLVELGAGFEYPFPGPALLRRAFHRGETISPGEGFGFLCVCVDVGLGKR